MPYCKLVLTSTIVLLLIAGVSFIGDSSENDAAVVISGSCGMGANYVLDGSGLLTINGWGTTYDYTYADGTNNVPWKDYSDSVTSIAVSSQITGLGNNLFSNLNNLEYVVVPSAITNLGNGVFRGCQNLQQVTFLSNLFSAIPANAFYMCASLTAIDIPPGINSIGENAFSYTGLESISIPLSIRSIGSGCFESCNLKTVLLPEYLSEISSRAFFNCKNLKSIVIPGNVYAIRPDAFGLCSNLTTVEIQSTYAFIIGDYAFYNCKNIQKISFPQTISSISEIAFADSVSFYDYYGKAMIEDYKELQGRTFEGSGGVLKDVIDPIHTVYFDANGGIVETKSLKTGEDRKLSQLPIPTWANHEFKYWYMDGAYGSKITLDQIYVKDTVLYAQWIEIEPSDDDPQILYLIGAAILVIALLGIFVLIKRIH